MKEEFFKMVNTGFVTLILMKCILKRRTYTKTVYSVVTFRRSKQVPG